MSKHPRGFAFSPPAPFIVRARQGAIVRATLELDGDVVGEIACGERALIAELAAARAA